MDARKYLEQIVEPTIADFEGCPYSRRHAFLACLVTFHTTDYIALSNRHGNLREIFRKASKEFAIIERVAHAFKHVKTGNPNNANNQPLSVKQVYSRPPAMAGVMQCGASRLGDTIGGVALWGEDCVDLLPTVKQAAAFLRTKCGELQCIIVPEKRRRRRDRRRGHRGQDRESEAKPTGR